MPCGWADVPRWTGAAHWPERSTGLEQIKASIRVKVEHPFRVIKQQFGHAKVRYLGLSKNKVRSLRRQFRG